MANIKSQKKRITIGERNNLVNSARKAEMRTAVKKVETLVAAGKKAEAEAALKDAVSLLDQFSKAGTLTINSAARKKSHLAKAVAGMK